MSAENAVFIRQMIADLEDRQNKALVTLHSPSGHRASFYYGALEEAARCETQLTVLRRLEKEVSDVGDA